MEYVEIHWKPTELHWKSLEVHLNLLKSVENHWESIGFVSPRGFRVIPLHPAWIPRDSAAFRVDSVWSRGMSEILGNR